MRRIGAPLLFWRLWEETGCAAVVKDRLAGRGFKFDVERAVFVAVLHRLCDALALTLRLLTQPAEGGRKIYALHAPEVDCIS